MKKSLLLAAMCVLSTAGMAKSQKPKAKEGFQFTVVKECPITSIKNQNQSGTCWAFSSLSFLESELLRMGKGKHDLCEMFLVSKTMQDRATAAVRTHGDVSFSQGGSFYDMVYCLKNYGMCPESAMPKPGTPYGDTLPNHNELSSLAEAYVAAIAKGQQSKISKIWHKSLENIYNNYLGECPEKFNVDGKEYTPMQYEESLGLNPDDYVSLTSFTHHPFYQSFVIEVQDNWRWAQSYNLPLDEFMQVFDNALNNGYTVLWGADVSEKGFTRKGICVVPDAAKAKDEKGSDQARWVGKSNTPAAAPTEAPCAEKTITQEMRQEGYDNWETTDDHGMHIFGIAKDQNGKEYYMVKNSWGMTGYNNTGIWYASKAYVAYKTMNILVNKKAIPAAIREKLHI